MHTSRPYKIPSPQYPALWTPVQTQEARETAEIEPHVAKSLWVCLAGELDGVRLGTIAGSEAEETAEVGIERAIC
jgi:hypothetical protein